MKGFLVFQIIVFNKTKIIICDDHFDKDIFNMIIY